MRSRERNLEASMARSDDERPHREEHITELDDDMNTTLTARLPTPTPSSVDTTLARLVVLAGDQVGRTYVIGSEALIGRAPETTIQLPDARVSRLHAALRPLVDGGFEIEDLDSRNGTTVDGTPVKRTTLQYGARIQLGAHVLLFSYHDMVQEQVLHRQKMEAVGQLAGGIAHDFNNLLGAGIATLEYIDTLPQDHQVGSTEVLECLTDLWATLKRGEELTRRLLGFQRKGRTEHSIVDISSLCTEVVSLARRTIGRSIELRHQIQDRLFVQGHQGELHQVLMNLLINARDAMPEGGTITVVAERSSGGAQRDESDHVVITISDSGTGIDAEILPHLFEPFFTTKAGSSGTGLGLATVHDVVTSHGGTVDVDSTVGLGTTFSVVLPARDRSPSMDKPLRTTMFLTLKEEEDRIGRVLVVDDEELVRRSLGRLLRHAGHTVLEARNGAEAINVFRLGDELPDLVLLDIEMPGLDGVATLEEIRTFAPEVSVVCVTGGQDRNRVQRLRQLGVSGMLEKPFEAQELLMAVSTGLRGQ